MPVSENNIRQNNLAKNVFQKNTSNTITNDVSNIGSILASESLRNRKEPWCRLNQTEKNQKLTEYADTISKERSLNPAETNKFKQYLENLLNKKRLQRVKDVEYDIDSGSIKSIPNLSFNSIERRFTLKRGDRHISTIKSLGHGRTRKKPVIGKIDSGS